MGSWAANNKEKHAAQSRKALRKFRIEQPVAHLLRKAKSRAKEEGLPFDIDVSDLTMPTACPLLGILLIPNHDKGKAWAHSPTLDKIKPELGYVRGNVRIISMKANTMKQDATPEMLIRFADRIEDYLGDHAAAVYCPEPY